MSLFQSSPACRLFPMATPTTASTSTQPAPPSKPLVATGDWTKNLVHLAKTAELKYAPNTSIEPEKIVIDLLQEACPHPATPYRAYSFCARVLGTEEQGDSRFERTEEQVEDLFSITSPHVFFSRPPSRFLLDPWNADLCCPITYFLSLLLSGSKAREINCSMPYERSVSSAPTYPNASRPNSLQFVGQ